jgi:GntR family transcriptional repressor for pyruvate dehydrogenase complex
MTSVFDPVDASSTYEETLRRIGIAIRTGVLAPGSKLPPERDLAEQLGISRSTLRHALATLTEQGHLTAVRGRLGGTFVAERPPLASGAAPPPEDWEALLDRRLAIELGVVQLAAERSSDLDWEALSEASDRLDAALGADYASFRRADIAFHIALAESTGNPRLVADMTTVHGDLSELFARVGYPDDARQAASAGHRRVLEAIRAGDAKRAVAAMREHLEGTERLMRRSDDSVS